MKTWLGLFLMVGAFMAGCAPGDYARPAYQERQLSYRETGMWHQNPESDAERDNRIWREESGR